MAVNVRERILDTATQLFYRDGIHRVGIDLVIAESGVAKMSLYRHFGSKEKLAVAFSRPDQHRVVHLAQETSFLRARSALSQFSIHSANGSKRRRFGGARS